MIPLRRHLLLVVLGALLPMLVLAGALTWRVVQEDRRSTEAALHENARLLIHALDAELSRSIIALQTLARSDTLRRDDLAGFYERAKDARDSLGVWENVILVSPQGEHLFNLMRPFGAKLPPLADTDAPRETAHTGQPFISNVLRGRVETDWLMFVNYPAHVDGEVKYVLSATMSSRRWSRWLAERAPKGYIASIIDRNFVILARTVDAEKLVGQPVQPWFRDVLSKETGRTVRGEGVVDPDVVVAFQRSELSGWYINLLTSGRVLDAPAWRSAMLLVLGVALAFALAAGLAVARARVLTRDIEGVVEQLQGGLRRQAEEERRLNEALSAADRRKDEFLATLAHELRNPLAPIRSAVELLKHPQITPQMAARAHDVIDRQSRHMTRLVEDLLEIGRITRGELQLRREPVELAAAVRAAAELTEAAYGRGGVTLAVELPGEPLWVDADPTRLAQILGNLLGNAGKFSPRGARVTLSARREGGQVEIRVRDEGAGIDAEQMPRLFQMFSQAAPALAREHGGLGIGLALVRGLVERHGGTVEAKSEGLGRGAEFIVRLPAAEAPSAASLAPAASSAPAGATAANGGGARRVLVADDNRDAADGLAEVLRSLGHQVRVAYDGEEALAAGAEFRPDTVILDIGMPRLNGYDAAARVRSSDWGRGALLVALTGWGQESDKVQAAQAGFDRHLTKPVEIATLQALLAG